MQVVAMALWFPIGVLTQCSECQKPQLCSEHWLHITRPRWVKTAGWISHVSYSDQVSVQCWQTFFSCSVSWHTECSWWQGTCWTKIYQWNSYPLSTYCLLHYVCGVWECGRISGCIDPFRSIWFPWYCHTGGQVLSLMICLVHSWGWHDRIVQ